MNRVNIGCGQNPTPGWRNFDNSLSLRLARVPLLPQVLKALRLLAHAQYEFISFARSHAIEYGDATKGLPLPNASVEVLYSSHMPEHLDPVEVGCFLDEAQRLLCPGGIIRLAVPDIRKQVMAYLSHGDADTFISCTHLAQPRPRSLASKLQILFVGTRHHQWMYDGASLCRLLKKHGFEAPTIVPPATTSIPNSAPLDLAERVDESVYVEALKRRPWKNDGHTPRKDNKLPLF